MARGSCAAAGAAAFGVYLATAAPTITWRNGGSDGPELAAAAYVWGVAHPPGYPLYLAAVRLAQLLPVGDVAYRAGLFSALCAAAAAALVCATVLALLPPPRTRTHRIAALYAGTAFAFTPLLWSQAVIVEVYAFGAALFGGVLLALARALARPALRSVGALAALLALLISHQPTFGVALAPLAWLAWRGALPPRLALRCAPLLLLAPLALLALWARAAHDPPLNWGDPSSPARWLHHVTAADYRHYFLARPILDELPRIPYAVALLARQAGWLAVVLAAFGAAWLWATHRAWALAGAFLAAYFFVFAVLYNAADGEIYLLPVTQLLAAAAGVGAWWLLESAASAGRRARSATARAAMPAGAVVLAIAVAWQLGDTWRRVDASGDYEARRWGEAFLRDQPPGATVRIDGERETFVLWFLQAAEGQRPDVVVVNRHLWDGFSWYRERLLRQHPGRPLAG